MSRLKLARFEQNRQSPNVIESGKELFTTIKGKWRETYFKNDRPIVLELACGKGEYTVGLARHYKENNFIGVDRKGDRIARGSQQALDEGLDNVAFLRVDILQLGDFFEPGEVDEIWITFPDPQPRQKKEKKRLTYPRFLELYRQILKENGVLHLKTDNTEFFEYSLETLPASGFTDLTHTHDLYASELNLIHLGIKTKYEELFTEKGFSIKYLQCKNKKATV
ncbi:tRNA (guanosine(46)-N7)-methyltransferase TrmB [Tellurirhabdus bombi]|uniref:tRNA (guanosine(46)-N7)-methyltransferase TrmB n=1 Tax=Tellurirhabdus bombi TaxID=2907205 RepID=UPI001F329C49|nr:tRNA (guanosine(46)-N7)-methyltransferase TrmB [Tellurirhabdus bombi]